ncbi:envelope glycoprotein [Rhynchospora pubera]|uniref:Envelope glycoprotein n=1 Tax=Rhynchospora pubera TaxID=906938 RepID=A0AAV8EJN7_9POAL|nr:envelope glycoprotein [Rhynchospora pubera]
MLQVSSLVKTALFSLSQKTQLPRHSSLSHFFPFLRNKQRLLAMVLWEITAITAYFLGLKRTYKLALRIQRRLIGPNHPKIRDFVYRRTRDVFNVAVSVHKNIQERDLEAGRNLGSIILRWLDRMKPSAQIRPHHHLTSSCRPASSPLKVQKPNTTSKAPSDSSSNGKVLFTPLNIRSKILSSVPVSHIMRQGRSSGMNSNQFRRLSVLPQYSVPRLSVERRGLVESVFRKDIAQLMMMS